MPISTITSAAEPTSPASPNPAKVRGDLEWIFELVREDFAAVNTLIPRQLTSDVDLVEEIGRYIVESGGKRLRPLLVLLGARCCGYDGNDHIRLAAVIEFLHTATLLHDDVVDRSGLRRGRATANALWGNAPSVLVGDFLYSRAFQLMVQLNNMNIMAVLSDATNTIAEGEVMQLANVGNSAMSESDYLEVIRCKTALLFEAASHCAGLLATGAGSTVAAETLALKNFGTHFGIAYQLVDDWLDYAGDSQTMGKNVGDDLAEGKLTLPLIFGLANSSDNAGAVIRQALTARSNDSLDSVIAIVQESGALDYTQQKAQQQGALALTQLDALPANQYRDALQFLAEYSISRLS